MGFVLFFQLKFSFDSVLDNSCDQEEAFAEVALPTVQDVKAGYNGNRFVVVRPCSSNCFLSCVRYNVCVTPIVFEDNFV